MKDMRKGGAGATFGIVSQKLYPIQNSTFVGFYIFDIQSLLTVVRQVQKSKAQLAKGLQSLLKVGSFFNFMDVFHRDHFVRLVVTGKKF